MGQLDRDALNQAFWDLGLRFQWDEALWQALAAFPDLNARMRHYLTQYQPHLLGVYDADFLARLIEERLANPIDPRVGMEAHRS
jgi:hypothetical protein